MSVFIGVYRESSIGSGAADYRKSSIGTKGADYRESSGVVRLPPRLAIT